MDGAQERPRAKTSSERGRAFRERERKRIASLEQSVKELQHEIQEKTFLKSVWNAKYLRARHTKYGSLMRLAEEYYQILKYGVPPEANGTRSRQCVSKGPDAVEFLERVTHPCAILGDVVGPQGMIDQWRKYTDAHQQFETRIYGVEVLGPEEDPVVFARLVIRARLTRKTCDVLFPNRTCNEDLVQGLIGKQIEYPGTTHFRFSNDMRIVVQAVHLSFVEGLLAVGAPLHQVHELMQASAISPTCTIHDASDTDFRVKAAPYSDVIEEVEL